MRVVEKVVPAARRLKSGVGDLIPLDGGCCFSWGTLARCGLNEDTAVSLSILNSVSSLVAENSLNQTAASLQKSLLQITTGLKINSIISRSNAVTSAVNVVNNGDGTIFIPINNPTDTLGGTLTLSTVVPDTTRAAQEISPVNNGNGTLIGSINPADTLSGSLSVTSTTSSTGGVQSAMSLTTGCGGTTITGTIPPADSLGASVTITSTIPQSGGVSSAVTLANSSSITGNIANGNTLTGSVTVTSTIPNPQTPTFSASGSGTSQVITSNAIATGTTLSGTLVVNSTGTAKTDNRIASATLNLRNYGGLSSSNAATASAEATQLAADLTTALKPSTGSTYTSTISGGVLTINSANAGSSQSLDFISSGGGKVLTSANPLVAGATLGGNFKIRQTAHPST